MPKLEYNGQENSVWKVSIAAFKELADINCGEQGPQFYINMKRLSWYKLENVPCVAGDDMFAAWSEIDGIGYFTFDGYMSKVKAESEESFFELICNPTEDFEPEEI